MRLISQFLVVLKVSKKIIILENFLIPITVEIFGDEGNNK